VTRLLCILILGISAAGRARAESPTTSPSECPSFFDRLSHRLVVRRTKPDPDAYEKLRQQAMGEYFPGTKEIEVQTSVKAVGADLNEAAVNKFHSDFDSLLDQRASLFNLNADGFRIWLKQKFGSSYPTLDPFTVENVYKKQNMSLEDLQSSFYMAYAVESKRQGIDVLKTVHAKDLARLGVKISLGVAAFILGSLKTAVVFGTVSNVMNSLLSAPMAPVQESAAQLSNVMLANVAKEIQQTLSHHMKDLSQQVAAVSATTNALDDTNFDGLSRPEAKKLMTDFDNRYFEIFNRMSAYKTATQRAGRDIVRDWTLLQPLQIVTSTATFENSYTLNKSLMEALEEKIGDHDPTPEQKTQLLEFKQNMDTAEDRLAGALATWRLYTFIYAEVSRDPQVKEANDVMFNTLGRYEDSMDMNKYRKDLSDRVKIAFHNFDPSFTGLDKLEYRKGTP
jgi:hypothetical protein